MNIKCRICGKTYNWDKSESCPKCGSYNGPPDGRGGSRESRPSFWKSDAAKFAWVGIALVFVLALELGWKGAKMAMEASRERQYAAGQASSVDGAAGPSREAASEPIRGIVGLEPESSPEEESEEEVVVQGPVKDISQFVTASFDEPLMEADGVQITVNGTGVVDDPNIAGLLNPEEKCIFVDFTAVVKDREATREYPFNTPAVTVGKSTVRIIWFSGVPSARENFTQFDFDLLREADTVRGQIFYAVPRETVEFMFRYYGRDGSMQSQRLHI